MKKLCLKLALYLLPFLAVFLLFLAFEPSNYFGLRESYTYASMPLSSLRALRREQPANIILGDSRMANLNTDYVAELTGEPYFMLGYGGAQTGELLELFWYAAEHTELKRVVFGINLYSSVGEQGAGRIPSVVELAENPKKFLTNVNNWLDAVNAAKNGAKNLLFRLMGQPERMVLPEDPTDYTLPQNIPTGMGERYRADLEQYCEVLKGQLTPDSVVEDSLLQRIGEMIAYCNQNGIQLLFVYPPMHESALDIVVEQQGLLPQMARYKSYIAARAPVCDLEFRNSFTQNADNFYDAFHLANSQKRYLAELIFTDIPADCVRRTTPDEVLP